MPMAAGPATPSDRAPMAILMQPSPIPQAFARDAIMAWFRGEFAAANAIIDALCDHLTQLNELGGGGHGSEYESVFAAIHRRRLNWIPVLQMQKYFSIADVAVELRRVAAKKTKGKEEVNIEEIGVTLKEEECTEEKYDVKIEEIKVSLKEEECMERAEDAVDVERKITVQELKESGGDDVDEVVEEDSTRDDSSNCKVIDGGFQGQLQLENIQICSKHEDCETRRAQIKMTKGFIAKEPVKGHMVNVVKGLRLYEDIFTDSELFRLTKFINELHLAGRNGKLSGETFILFNQQLKGNKRELIQLGVPIFGQTKEEATSNIEPIPSVLQAVIDHLVQWHLIPESRKPNSCIINFFDEGEYSQPYLKPPHLDQPISTLLLSESQMAFGRVLVSDHHGNFKGPIMLSPKEGSLLVMRGNSVEMAKHVVCSSPNKRVSITFFKVRPNTDENQPATIPPLAKAMTNWQPGVTQPYKMPNGALSCYETMEVMPKWGVLNAPLVMLAPMRPMVMNPRRMPRGGTGVFLPWTVGSKKPAKHLPPRAQRGRLLTLPSPMETNVVEPASDPTAEG